MDDVGPLVEDLFRRQSARIGARLTRVLGPAHLDLAEEATQHALVRALESWPLGGVPENPAGWLYRVAHNFAIDSVRRARRFGDKTGAIVAEIERSAGRAASDAMSDFFTADAADDELRMVLLCCHPRLAPDTRVSLALRTVGGFSAREIARGLLAEEAAVAQRLVRAKNQIRDLDLTFELPRGPELAERVDSALEVVYLMFNEGYAAHEGEELLRLDLGREALRLGRLLADSALGTPRAAALVALLAFQSARWAARTDAAGDLVLLADQDRGLWDRRLIDLGFAYLARAAEGPEVSAYHVQAAIAATHARAATDGETDWPAILSLYDDLLALAPSPVVALNRAVAVGKVHGAARALEEITVLAEDPALGRYYLLPATRGHFLLAAGDRAAAAAAFRAALARPCSAPEQRFLQRKLAECE
jgi:RNA polymerase sigma-70 factor (ECF subfamily)